MATSGPYIPVSNMHIKMHKVEPQALKSPVTPQAHFRHRTLNDTSKKVTRNSQGTGQGRYCAVPEKRAVTVSAVPEAVVTECSECRFGELGHWGLGLWVPGVMGS